MKSDNKNGRWFFSEKCCVPIQFYHYEITLWVGVTDGEIFSVGVVEIQGDGGFRYYVERASDGSYGGYVAFAKKELDRGWVFESGDAVWMSAAEKNAMRSLLRRAASFRQAPMPAFARKIWEEAGDVVENLDIVNTGHRRFSS